MLNTLINMIYPPRCIICDSVLKVGEKMLCPDCRDKLTYIEEPTCVCCGREIQDDEEFCENCVGRVLPYDCGKSVLLYDENMKNSVSKFKYHGRQEFAISYAKIIYDRLYDWISDLNAEVLIPVPAHKSRLKKRGYNQAALIASELSKLTKISTIDDFLIRTKKTERQKELNAEERRNNLSGAFELNPVYFKKFGENSEEIFGSAIIVDDIFTTGSTMEECASVLRKIGVRNIYFICLCSTMI